MRYEMDLTSYQTSKLFSLGEDFSCANPSGERLSINNFYFEKNGKPFYPVSGEFHYSLMDDRRW